MREVVRVSSRDAGIDVVLYATQSKLRVEVVHDHHGNGTREVASLDQAGLKALREGLDRCVILDSEWETFGVESLDQVNEGREVWVTEADEILTVEAAREWAEGWQKEVGKRLRIVRNRREVLSELAPKVGSAP